MRSDQLQERSARANSSSSSSSVLLLLLCDTESLLWRDSCECTPPPLDRERESGGRAALARSWRPGRARSRDRDRDRESWQCGTAHLLESMSLSALHPKSAARVASRNSKMTEAVAVRLASPSSFAQDTHAVSVSPLQTIFHTGRSTNPEWGWDLPISSQTGNRTSPLRPALALSRELPQARMYSVCKDQNQRLDRDSQ